MAPEGDFRVPTSDKSSLYLEKASTHHAFRAFRADLGIACAYCRYCSCYHRQLIIKTGLSA